MPRSLALPGLTEADLGLFAGVLAFMLRPGDTVALHGDLGAGKTTLARAVIRALSNDGIDEIPSPTFTLVQSYATPRLSVLHADLYRLGDVSELIELGLDPLPEGAALLVEWPERAGDALDAERLEVSLSDPGIAGPDGGGLRDVTLTGLGGWEARAARLGAMYALIARWRQDAHLGSIGVRYMQGDASARRYALLSTSPPPLWGRPGGGDGRSSAVGIPPAPTPSPQGGGEPAILMDSPRQPDGPPIRDGKPYSRIAHLAEDVRPFVAVAGALAQAGIATPAILAHDMANGFLVTGHLGEGVFGEELKTGTPQEPLWRAATDVLVALRASPVPESMPLPDGTRYSLPPYDTEALSIETELLPDWYWPYALGAAVPDEARAEFTALWREIITRLAALPRRWVLRDYHSPNLIWRPERQGLARVGVIDFQDALAGPAEYDLVSLLQDARLDVPAGLEALLLDHYAAAVAASERSFDREASRFAYAALGAQRNTKIAGIFARLAKRDGKPGYLAHLPRIWGYLERNLAHPELRRLRAWYDRHLPPDVRRRRPST